MSVKITDMLSYSDVELSVWCQGGTANYTERQHGHSTHSGAPVTVWFHHVPCTWSILQDAHSLSVHLHECFHWWAVISVYWVQMLTLW